MAMNNKASALEIYKAATLSTMRALSGDKKLTVDFISALSPVSNKACLPLPPPNCSEQELSAARGVADEYALNQRYHDPSSHQVKSASGTTSAAIFVAAEGARIHGIGANHMAGVGRNLNAALEQSCIRTGYADEKKAASLPLATSLLLRERLTNYPLLSAAQTIANQWRAYIEEKAGGILDAMAAQMYNQETYEQHCQGLITALGFAVQTTPLPATTDGSNAEEFSQEASQESLDGGDMQMEPIAGTEDEGLESGFDLSADMDMSEAEFADQADDEPKQGGLDEQGRILKDPNYAIYTDKFDEVVLAQELCDPAEISKLYKLLNSKLQAISRGTARLANKLQRQLLAKQTHSWLFDQEEGLLDASRLASIVTSPSKALAFKKEHQTKFLNTVVTLLIDSSGSMRGRAITTAALCADILGHTLERCSVKVEVLGFTTAAWRGGQSREHWISAGKPKHPGRLNDLRHVIYKTADESWRRARRNLGLMMREELLKENIDGEALIWAHNRLVQRTEERKILLVISDGLPVDNSTLLVNTSNCLEQHLRYAIDLIEQRSKVHLIAIGIGHDVTHHYKRAVTVTDPEQLGGAMTDQLANLFKSSQE